MYFKMERLKQVQLIQLPKEVKQIILNFDADIFNYYYYKNLPTFFDFRPPNNFTIFDFAFFCNHF